MKIKPKIFDHKDPNEFKIFVTLYNIFSKSLDLESIYKCGSCENFLFASKTNRPKVCSRCGSEIDWTGKYTTIIKKCPTCHKQYNNWENFCNYCVPPSKLESKEKDLL